MVYLHTIELLDDLMRFILHPGLLTMLPRTSGTTGPAAALTSARPGPRTSRTPSSPTGSIRSSPHSAGRSHCDGRWVERAFGGSCVLRPVNLKLAWAWAFGTVPPSLNHQWVNPSITHRPLLTLPHRPPTSFTNDRPTGSSITHRSMLSLPHTTGRVKLPLSIAYIQPLGGRLAMSDAPVGQVRSSRPGLLLGWRMAMARE